MFLLIPFLAGAGATGYFWSKTKEEKEPTFKDEVFNILTPIAVVLCVLLLLRWLYKRGSE